MSSVKFSGDSTLTVGCVSKAAVSEVACILFAGIVGLHSLLTLVTFPLQIVYRMLHFLIILLGINHQFMEDLLVPGIVFIFLFIFSIFSQS